MEPVKLKLKILFILIICITAPIAFADQTRGTESSNIVTVDMPYNLFIALASYHELTEAEANGENINKEIIPVIETIIDELMTEHKKCKALIKFHNIKDQLEQVLKRLDKHLQGFRNELSYRYKVDEHNRLIEKQKTLINK